MCMYIIYNAYLFSNHFHVSIAQDIFLRIGIILLLFTSESICLMQLVAHATILNLLINQLDIV